MIQNHVLKLIAKLVPSLKCGDFLERKRRIFNVSNKDFKYCSLIWTFCSRYTYSKIN